MAYTRVAEISGPRTKHGVPDRRLTRMTTTIRPVAIAVIRTVALVAFAMLLILVLLPAVLAVQAATG
jgi:hypothetical protein